MPKFRKASSDVQVVAREAYLARGVLEGMFSELVGNDEAGFTGWIKIEKSADGKFRLIGYDLEIDLEEEVEPAPKGCRLHALGVKRGACNDGCSKCSKK